MNKLTRGKKPGGVFPIVIDHSPVNPTPLTPADLPVDWITSHRKNDLPCVPDHAFFMKLTINHSHLGTIIPHVSKLEYVRWLEVLATAHAESLGFNDDWYTRRNLIWFVGRHEIDYLAELVAGDELCMATWVEKVEKYRADRRYFMMRKHDRKPACAARTSWILVSRDWHRPVRVPEDLIAAFISP